MRCRFQLATIIAIVFLSGLTVSGSLLPRVQGSDQPMVRLGALYYQSPVRPGANFQVNATAWYSGNFLADIGVWDQDTGLIVESMTFISQFLGPGNVSFTLSLTAPDSIGKWHLLVVNRVWWRNAWYQDPKGGEEQFTVTIANNTTLTLGSSGAPLSQISVDGTSYKVQASAPVNIFLPTGSHTLEAPSCLQEAPGVRIVFAGWSNGVRSDPYTVFLTGPTTLYAEFQSQYYLSGRSRVGEIVGVGWYANGTQATVAVPSEVMLPNSVLFTYKYRFTGWSGVNSSTNNPTTFIMNGPEEVTANWAPSGVQVNSNTLELVLLSLSLPLLVRLAFIGSSRRRAGRASRRRGGKVNLKLVCFFLSLLVFPLAVAPAEAQSIPQPRASLVRIGDAEWYFWSQPGSDTCLIWLGGGIPQVSEPGSYGYLINPYGYESFDTMRFIQDLTNFYCVIAMQQGSVESFDPASKRTIYQELFQPETNTLVQVHDWILEQGYVHTFVVGYSVGGQAAAADLTLAHPDGWTTQDGLILITVPFSQDLIANANELRTNLLLLYGGNLPDYESTGLRFYNYSRAEGPTAEGYFHKEFHVIEDAGHEVWTVRSTDSYDTKALNLVVGFIENSKARQLQSVLPAPAANSSGTYPLQIDSVTAPPTIRTGSSFYVEFNTTSASTKPLILTAFDSENGGLVSESQISGAKGFNVRLTIPAIPGMDEISLSIVAFEGSNQGWLQASEPYPVKIMDSASLMVETYFPNISFNLDGTQYMTNSSGLAELQVPLGKHQLKAQPIIYQGNTSRLRLVTLDTSWNHTIREIQLTTDTFVEIPYVQQYFVLVNSPYGHASGSGWYDANSTATVSVEPPVASPPYVIFSNWSTGANQSELTNSLRVSSPVSIQAAWTPMTNSSSSGAMYLDPWFILSLLAFIVLVVLNVKWRQGRVES